MPFSWLGSPIRTPIWMDNNTDISPDPIRLSLPPKKLKMPIVALLNEYEKDGKVDFDLFEEWGNDNCVFVFPPVAPVELHKSIEDMMEIVKIVTLKHEIGRDALKLAVHLLYRVTLMKQIDEYYNFVLYYEQFNKPWSRMSVDYHKAHEKWLCEITRYCEDVEYLTDVEASQFERRGQKRHIVSLNERFTNSAKIEAIESDRSTLCAKGTKEYYEDRSGTVEGTPSLSVFQFPDVKLLKDKEWHEDNLIERHKQSCTDVSRSCFNIEKSAFLEDCKHSQFVLYVLWKTGDFVLKSENDNYRCPCYAMKCRVIREVLPTNREMMWGKACLPKIKHWCFVNCIISSDSFQMLKVIHPLIVHVKEGFLSPCKISDVKRITLRTFALKTLVSSYLNM